MKHTFSIFFLLFTLGLSSPSMAKVVSANDIGFVVENEVSVSVSANQAFELFVSQVDQWWPKDHSWWGEEGTFRIDTQAGGCFCETAGAKSAEHMHIVFVDPGNKITMTGALGPLQDMGMSGALTFSFIELDGVTKVIMRNSVHGIFNGEVSPLAEIVDAVQRMQINGFKQRVEALNNQK